jgi:hypothetical protein
VQILSKHGVRPPKQPQPMLDPSAEDGKS